MKLTITAAQLRAKKACRDQLALFVATYGDSVTFTSEADLASAAATSKLNLKWFAERFLSTTLLAEYRRQNATIWAEYERQNAPLWAEYQRQNAPLWAEYQRQNAPILAEHQRQNAPILAEYQRQRAPLWAEYERQNAPLWAKHVWAALARKVVL